MHPDDGRVVSNFIVQALQGKPITLYGDGSQTRSFCYVNDMVEGLIRLMDTPDDITGPVNLGNPVEMPMRALAERVIALTGSASPITTLPLPQDDPLQRCPDIGLARRLLGWEPAVGLDAGLIQTIAYFDALLSERGSVTTPTAPAAYREGIF
jgi:UDP-glucuronate decarboxylase